MNEHQADPDQLPLVRDELDVLGDLVPLAGQRIIELGCGNARLARSLVLRHAGSQVVGLEVDAVQHTKNVSSPQERLLFVAGSAEAVPFPDAGFDGAMMLKSLHHVPLDGMDAALAEVARVVKPGGWFYVSEPIFGGALNEIVRLYNDENTVRRAAQAALDEVERTAARDGNHATWLRKCYAESGSVQGVVAAAVTTAVMMRHPSRLQQLLAQLSQHQQCRHQLFRNLWCPHHLLDRARCYP